MFSDSVQKQIVMDKPQKNEHWHVKYGANKKTDIIVKVISNEPEHGLKNWTKDSFKCDRLGEVVYVKGELFVERFSTTNTRVFTNPSRPA